MRLDHPDDSAELLERVRSGTSEVGITDLPVHADRVVTFPLLRHELVAVLPPGSVAPDHVTLTELARRPMVTLPPGTSTRRAIDGALAGAPLTVAVETDQREALGPLVLAGAGSTVLPRPMAEAFRAQGAVIAPLRPALWRSIGLVHRDATLSPAARAFVALSAGGAGGAGAAAAGRTGRSGSSARPTPSGG